MTNALQDTVKETIEAMQPKHVFGEPIERDGAVFVPAAKVQGTTVETVENLAGTGEMSVLQQAFHKTGASQCVGRGARDVGVADRK